MRCEGWTRHGGAFTFGPVTWSQCENDAEVILEVQQEEIEKQTACMDCWKKGIKEGIKIISVEPINDNQPLQGTNP